VGCKWWLCGLVSALLASSVIASESSSKTHPLVSAAKRYLGIRYRYGGSSPSRGFDCSGFVYYLLRRHGISAPHSAAELFRMGKPVSRSELKPGDLVFFRNTARRRGITHVGIYIGDGKFIHASSGRGCVTITSLSDPYYAARFAGARRLTLRKN
jgi:Cell wall-associated hydrolases (invasion-associated proteins)